MERDLIAGSVMTHLNGSMIRKTVSWPVIEHCLRAVSALLLGARRCEHARCMRLGAVPLRINRRFRNGASGCQNTTQFGADPGRPQPHAVHALVQWRE